MTINGLNTLTAKLNHPIRFLLYTLLLIVTGCIVLLASVPPVSRDALTHHLYVPRLWLENGDITPIADIPFSYYPMNLDLLYLIPLYFGNDIIPKYIHFFFALATAGVMYWYLKKRLSKNWGLLGALFFLTVPIIVKLSITVYVDLGLTFFTTVSLLCLLEWIRKQYQYPALIVAGIFCGLAAGTKYNGLITIFLLTLFVPFIYLQTNKKIKSSWKSILSGVIFLSCTLFAFSPWLMRNYTLTGNPIYPLHNTLIQKLKNDIQESEVIESKKTVNQRSNTLKTIASRNSGVFATRKILYNEQWWQTLLLPVRFFFEGQDDTPQFFDGKLAPFLLILPFFAFGRGSPTAHLKQEKFILLWFSILFFFFTFFMEAMRIRYIVSILPCLSILSIFGLHNIYALAINNKYPQKTRLFVTFFISILILTYNGNYILNQFYKVQPIQFLSGEISKDEYIHLYRNEYPSIQFANKILNRKDKVLCFFLGKRGYYMDFKPIFETPYAKGIISQHLTKDKGNNTIRNTLKTKGIKYVLLRNDLTQNWLNSLPKPQAQKFLSFLRSSRIIFQQSGYSLLKL